MHEIDGLRIVMDEALANHLQRYLPLTIDYDDRHWYGLRVRTNARACC